MAAGPTPSRPDMPADYGIATALPDPPSWEPMRAKLTEARTYWLATTRPDGRPHVQPVWGLWIEDAFWFSTDARSRKGRNLAANPAVAVHLESGDDVVVVEGRAEPVDAAALAAVRFTDLYDAKYKVRPEPSPDTPMFSFFRLRPTVAFTWQEQDFPTSALRWRWSGPEGPNL